MEQLKSQSGILRLEYASLESKLLHNLMKLREEVLYKVFL